MQSFQYFLLCSPQVQGLYVYCQGFALDFSELREYTHGFFSNMAEILDDGFTQVTYILFWLLIPFIKNIFEIT